MWLVILAALSALVLAAAAATAALRRRRYADFLGYDPCNDDELDASTEPVALILRGSELELPSVDGPSTALLAVKVRAAWWGRLTDPFVVVEGSGGQACRQYFERGVRGRRYINLTSLVSHGTPDGQSLRLTPHQCRLSREVALWLFPMPEVSDPVAVVAPHPDDAELSSFGVWADRETWVTTVSAGEIGTTSFGDLFPSNELGAQLRGQTRVTESLTAPRLGGVPAKRTANLGFFDGTLESMARNRSAGACSDAAGTADLQTFRVTGASHFPVRTVASWNGLLGDLDLLLRETRPRTLIAPHPLLDHHPDHRFVGLATLEAVAGAKTALPTDGHVLLYVVHPPVTGGGVGLHPVGRRDGVASLPPGRVDRAWYDSIASYPLDDDRLRRKTLAVDTYRDLREEPTALHETRPGRRIIHGFREVYRALAVYDATLFRRHLRPNELFFTVPYSRAKEMHATFRRALLPPTSAKT